MKRVSMVALLFLLCATLCMGACTPDNNDVPPQTDTTVTTEEATTEEATTDESTPTPPVNVVVNKDLVEPNFYQFEDKTYDDAQFTFVEENGKRILKQERIFFASDAAQTQSGKKWDAATNAWMTASDVTTDERMYNIKLKEALTDGELAIKFQFKREGGSKQVFCIKPSGIAKSVGGVYFSNDSIKIGNIDVHLNSQRSKKVKLPEDEWLYVTVNYYLTFNGFSVSAVVTDEFGTVLGSLSSHPTESNVSKITGIDIIDTAHTNIADYGNANPDNPTSVWYMKDLSVKANPMETGDRIQLKYKTVNNSPNRGDIVSNYITINGQQTIRAYFGIYSLMPDNSGFICGTNDGNFYFYSIEDQELIYLDRSLVSLEEQTQVVAYVNPATGNVFYQQKNERGNKVVMKINPKTFEKTVVYECTNSRMNIGLEVTYDEKYTYYYIGGYMSANVPTYVGRINFETGELEYEREIVYSSTYCVNHFMLNPKNPDLLFYHREAHVGINENDHSNVINLVTNERYIHAQRGDISSHALWSYDGEYITMCCSINGADHFTVLTSELEEVSCEVMSFCTHPMADENMKWVMGDMGGVCLMNLETGTTYNIFTKPAYREKHPYHAHSEISMDGKILFYGFENDDGVLSIGWLQNPEWTE